MPEFCEIEPITTAKIESFAQNHTLEDIHAYLDMVKTIEGLTPSGGDVAAWSFGFHCGLEEESPHIHDFFKAANKDSQAAMDRGAADGVRFRQG